LSADILAGVVEKAKGAIVTQTDLIAAIAGAGSVAALVTVIRSWAPGQTEGMTDETVAAIGGLCCRRIRERGYQEIYWRRYIRFNKGKKGQGNWKGQG